MRAIEAKIVVNVAPDKALSEFLNMQGIQQWWGATGGLIDAKEGGVWSLHWKEDAGSFKYVQSGLISKYDPGRILEISNYIYLHPEHPTFGPMVLTFAVSKVANGTEVMVRQDGYLYTESWNWYYDAVTLAWPQVLEQYADYLQKSLKAAAK